MIFWAVNYKELLDQFYAFSAKNRKQLAGVS